MAQGVVFKQWYKSINLPGIAARNQKHLNYIATRKGCIPNPGCGFGLWGRLPDRPVGNIYSLEQAKKVVGTASEKHTLYRAIVSVDKDTAQKYDLYSRDNWERLVADGIRTLAKEMEIEPQDFCWVASMHHKKTHPHVHIIYWDNSNKVRNEFIPPERFEILAEKVRASFNRGIFHEEIKQLQADQKEVISQARLELMAMCRDANLSDALNLDLISKAKLDELTQDFASLVLSIPKKGSLRYQTLPVEFKDQLNAFIDKIMKLTDFEATGRKYMKITDEISDLYGNGESTKQHNREAATQKLYSELGNGVLNTMREYLEELKSLAPSDADALRTIIRDKADALIRSDADYGVLLETMPVLQTPMHVVREDKQFQTLHKKIASDVCNDVRIRTQVQGYSDTLIRQLPPTRPAAKGDTVEFLKRNGTAVVVSVQANGLLRMKVQKNNGESYSATAKQEDVRVVPENGDGITIAKLREQNERNAYKAVCEVLDDRIFIDSGYHTQMQAQTVLRMLLRLFADFTQGTNQQKSQRDLAKSRSKDMSKAARRDRKKQLEQGGSWDFEM